MSIAATTAARVGRRPTRGCAASVVGATRTGDGALLLADAGGRLASTRRWRPHVPDARAQAAGAVTGLAEIGNGRARACRPARRQRRRYHRRADRRLARNADHGRRLQRTRPDAGRPATSRNSTGTRATGSSAWCSTTGWRWSWSAPSSRLVLGYFGGDAARAERELREDDSAEPAVHQELPHLPEGPARTGQFAARRGRERRRRHFRSRVSRGAEAGQRRAGPDAGRGPRVGEVAVDARRCAGPRSPRRVSAAAR